MRFGISYRKILFNCFSSNVQDIFENFKIKERIRELAKADLLFRLIKKFSESKVMTGLIFIENGEKLKQRNIIKTVYDPACDTGSMLTSCEDFIMGINSILSFLIRLTGENGSRMQMQ